MSNGFFKRALFVTLSCIVVYVILSSLGLDTVFGGWMFVIGYVAGRASELL